MSNLFLLDNTSVLDLFEIKLNDFDGYFRFHGSKNLKSNIIFKEKEYIFIPCEISNLEYSSEAKQNRPTLSIANVNNYISNLIKDRKDLIGKRFYRKKILTKDLDDVNFGGSNKNTLGVSSFSSFISVDTFVIQKKNSENKDKVEFQLANILDLDGQTVPSRKVYNDICQWQYRGYGCNYGKLSDYDGPTIPVKITNFSTLASVISVSSNDLLTTNLSLWLNNTTEKTYGSTTTEVAASSGKKYLFQKLTAWADSSTTINTSGTAKNITLTGNLKKFTNSGRLNNQEGAFLLAEDSLLIDSLFFGSGNDLTIFYVSETTNKRFDTARKGAPNGGYIARGLASSTEASNKNFLLGYDKGWADLVYPSNTFKEDKKIWGYYDLSPKIYGYTHKSGEKNALYKNGTQLFSKNISSELDSLKLSFNILGESRSDIVVYEVIVFNKKLNDAAIKSVFSYLSIKYNIQISNYYQNLETIKGSTIFSQSAFTQEGNLGVAVADENNKLFLKYPDNIYSNFESYGLTSLSYKGDYNSNTVYSQGDFVKIDEEIDFDFNETVIQKNSILPSRFFVCLSNEGVSAKHPMDYTNIWKEDKCSRNLNGCSLRFNNIKNIPFGSFPGTLSYDYKLPGS
jgi:lambda family phage minor tail protein L